MSRDSPSFWRAFWAGLGAGAGMGETTGERRKQCLPRRNGKIRNNCKMETACRTLHGRAQKANMLSQPADLPVPAPFSAPCSSESAYSTSPWACTCTSSAGPGWTIHSGARVSCFRMRRISRASTRRPSRRSGSTCPRGATSPPGWRPSRPSRPRPGGRRISRSFRTCRSSRSRRPRLPRQLLPSRRAHGERGRPACPRNWPMRPP